MSTLQHLLDRNRDWAARITAERPDFFRKLAGQQAPAYLWIGCSDSRVPANEIVDLLPGELFVHRNIANVVVHTDLNCLSVVQFAVEVLRVRHIMVVGHYGCGGIRVAWESQARGLSDNWLRHVEDVALPFRRALEALPAEHRLDRLAELNVLAQVTHVCRTTVVQEAWARDQALTVHGWIYGLEDGRLHDLGLSVGESTGLTDAHAAAVARLGIA